MHSVAMAALLALQCFVVLFVALHNWIPLGTLNNVRGVRAEFPTGKLLLTTLINFAPVAIGLAATAFYFGRACPAWVFWWLWITYGPDPAIHPKSARSCPCLPTSNMRSSAPLKA